MSNGAYFEAYCKFCELANDAAEKGQALSAAAFYRQALEYSDKMLASQNDDGFRQQLIIRSKEIVKAIVAFERQQEPKSISPEKGSDREQKRKDTWFDAEIPKLCLKDVMGLEEVIAQIEQDIIIPIKYPDIYAQYANDVGARILLYGPPGTGKTFVVRCLAGELKCKIALAPAQKILDKYVGEAEAKVGEIFEEADKYDRSLIFFDEIDALASDRDSDDSRHTKGILTVLLNEMDGFSSKKEKNKLKIIIAATNKPWSLDPAIRRGGRFDTQIYVGLPVGEPPKKGEPPNGYTARYYMIERAFRLDNGSYPPIEGTPDMLFHRLAVALDKWYGGGDIVAICKRIAKGASRKAAKLFEKDPTASLPKITFEDCETVIKNTPRNVTQTMLDKFEEYKRGLK